MYHNNNYNSRSRRFVSAFFVVFICIALQLTPDVRFREVRASVRAKTSVPRARARSGPVSRTRVGAGAPLVPPPPSGSAPGKKTVRAPSRADSDLFDLIHTCPEIKIGLEIELKSAKPYARGCPADYTTNIATIDTKAVTGGSPSRQIGKIMGEEPVVVEKEGAGGKMVAETYCKIEFVSRAISLGDVDDLKSFMKLARKADCKFSNFLTQTGPIHPCPGCASVAEPTFNALPTHAVDDITLHDGRTVRETVGDFSWVAKGDFFRIESVQLNVGIPTISFAYAFDMRATKDLIGFDVLNEVVRSHLPPPAAVTEADSFGLLQKQLTAEVNDARDRKTKPTKDTHPILPKSRSDKLLMIRSPKLIPPFTCHTAGGKATEGLVVEVRNDFNGGQPVLNNIKDALRNGAYCHWADRFIDSLLTWWSHCIEANPGPSVGAPGAGTGTVAGTGVGTAAGTVAGTGTGTGTVAGTGTALAGTGAGVGTGLGTGPVGATLPGVVPGSGSVPPTSTGGPYT